ncbi:DUF1003 domain-containing protein [Clostridium estertheticum]|uniref:DUF1003 domain-containing protein n=1 Tax=Clostridium estertheticum TaxID=238834 RepID=A0AA47EHE2_9CLOT|nr:DUF1003 domain-containing protein [Clostridium estertheticum]MBU3155594.1 DUF1003 domain-containing protein [Clostridium estertheticum]MBU3198117.1 DUF1003 domain-containing protein [Clostridium estertheticum]WAG60011.1 DUF1003 domain-containing protein [Clostridium estertheticum]WAG65909.1 DUF1003 domain-containing protein [Clostridium estertheticum]
MENENDNSDSEKLVREIIDQGETFNDIEEDLLHELIENRMSTNSNIDHAQTTTFGNKMADKIAASVGSWSFIIAALAIIAIWIIINTILKKLFDPFPFILLNLVLSCTAAIQAPVIMMSQNRQEDKDRIKSKNDYKINLKSELITQDLHKKMDYLIDNQKILVKNQAKILEFIEKSATHVASGK